MNNHLSDVFLERFDLSVQPLKLSHREGLGAFLGGIFVNQLSPHFTHAFLLDSSSQAI
jgi:hypothetical protein